MDSRPSFQEPERLLAESAWLARLARSLVGNPEDASDLAQDTFAAALAHPPASDRPLRPWLARVAHNLAVNRGASRVRRTAREERVARPEALASASDVVQRVAMQRTVVEAVLALDEPYRSVLLLRYWDDLAPRRIAERTAVPVETVRTRLKRGLALLRERLDSRHGDRETWMSALLPLARNAALPSAGTAAIASAVGGVLAMNSLTKVALALVVAIAAVWIVRDTSAPAPVNGGLRSESERESPETAANDQREQVLATESRGARRSEVAAAPVPSLSATRNEVRLTVFDDVTGSPLVGAHAAFYQSGGGNSSRTRRATADSSAGGVLLLEDPRADGQRFDGNAEVEVWADERAALWIAVRSPQSSSPPPRVIDLGDVRLPRGCAVRGRVVDSGGVAPVAGARLLLMGVTPYGYGMGISGALEVGVCDSEGRFQLERRLAPPANGAPRMFALTKEGMGWATVGVVDKRETVDDLVVRIRPSAQLEVEVVEAAGSPIEGVTVNVWPKFEPLGIPYSPQDSWLGNDPWTKENFSAQTNAQGLATFSRLPIDDDPIHSSTGARYKVAATAKGKREATRSLDLDPKQPTRIRLTLDPFAGVTLTGRVLAKDGAPIAGATLSEKRPGSRSASSDAQGGFTFVLPSTKLIRLDVGASGYATRTVERAVAADESSLALDITLSRESRLEGLVVDQTGSPLKGFSIYAQRFDEPMHQSKETGDDGHFTLEGLDESYWSLNINQPVEGDTWDGPGAFTACAADSPLTLRMNKIEAGHARIQVELLDALTKKPLTPVVAHMLRLSDRPMASGRGLNVVRELGVLRADGLSAGRWRVSVETVEGARGERVVVVSPTDLDIRLQWELGGPGRIVGRVDFDDVPREARPQRGFLVTVPFGEGQWVPAEGQDAQKVTRGFAPLADKDGWSFRLEDVVGLEPVVLELSAGPYIARTEAVVPAGGEAHVVIHPKAAGTLCFEREGERRISNFELELQCADDSALRESTYYQSSSDEKVLRTVIVPAGHVRWRIRYWSPSSTENGGVVALEGDADVAGGATTRVGVRF